MKKAKDRWDEYKPDYPAIITAQRTSHIGDLGFSVLPIDYGCNRDKFYESRDKWLGEYVFGK